VLNQDQTLSILGSTTYSITDLHFQPPSGNFVGNFNDFYDANWIHDQPGTFDPGYTHKRICVSPDNHIYVAGDHSQLIKHGPSFQSNLGSFVGSKLSYAHNRVLGIAKNYWMPYNVSVMNTADSSTQSLYFGPQTVVQSMVEYNSGYLVGGGFIDTLVCKGVNVVTNTGGKFNMFLMQLDSEFNLVDFHLVPGMDNSTGMWPEIILPKSSDIVIAGPITNYFTVGTFTLAGHCCPGSTAFYAKLSAAPMSLGEDVLEASGLKIYPNPASQAAVLRFPEMNSTFRCRVMNALGESELELISDRQEIDLPVQSLKAGVYIVQVISEGHSYSRKLLVSK
jgi:hypothetical protein